MSAHWTNCASCGEAVLLREGQAFARCENCRALVIRSSSPTWRPNALAILAGALIWLAAIGVVVALLL